MSLSSTRVQAMVEAIGKKPTTRLISDLIEEYFPASAPVEIPYRTELYLARRIRTG